MALMFARLYEALKSAGVDESTAQKAAEEVAAFRNGALRPTQSEGGENPLIRIEADLRLLKWIMAANIALAIIVLWRVCS